jgi:hypothetical protein
MREVIDAFVLRKHPMCSRISPGRSVNLAMVVKCNKQNKE